MAETRISQREAARGSECTERTVRRYVEKKQVTVDRRKRVLLSEVLAVARQKKKHGRSVVGCYDRRQASRVLQYVLEVLIWKRDSSKAAVRFFKGAHTQAWRDLPDNPPLEQDLVRNGLSRLQTLVLTARFICEYSRADTHNPALLSRPTKKELKDARYIKVKGKDGKDDVQELAGELTLWYVPGKGVFVKRGQNPGEVPTKQEALCINTALEKTALSSHARGASRGLIEPKPRKRGYTLAFLCGWSRQRANYWRRKTDAVWPAFRDFCLKVLQEGATQLGNTDGQRCDVNADDGWNVEAYLNEQSTKVPTRKLSLVNFEEDSEGT
jgi:hypothetical protein